MKNTTLLLSMLLCILVGANGQRTTTEILSSSSNLVKSAVNPEQIVKKYYNANKKEVQSPDQATFYREYRRLAEKLWQVCEYRMDNKSSMEAYFTSVAYESKNGPYRVYYPNGKIDSEGMFKNDNMDGKWFFYYENGVLAAKEIYEEGLKTEVDCWNPDGTIQTNYMDSEREKPSYPQGQIEMDKFVQNTIVLPDDVQKKKVTGKMAISFFVEPDGKLTNPKIELSLHPSLDEAAFKVLDAMPAWIPAKHHNRLIRQKFIMPIVISLKK
jgi:periplasmic protein TonB